MAFSGHMISIPTSSAEWEAETDVLRLVKCYRGSRWFDSLRMFAVACCRRIWDFVPAGTAREAIQTAENFANGRATKRELQNFRRDFTSIEAARERCYGGIEE